MLIDLDAARAARREAEEEAPILRFGGEDFTLPVELPLELGQALLADDAMGSLRCLLSPEDLERFMALRPSTKDVWELIRSLASAYGMTAGESRASGASSVNGSTRSRPTSNGSTSATSAKRAGGKKR